LTRKKRNAIWSVPRFTHTIPGGRPADHGLFVFISENYVGSYNQKLALYQSMQEQEASNMALARRLRITEGAVRRLIHPDHTSCIEKVQVAIEALGKHPIVEAA
jgi:hypothetical protein